MCEHQIHIFMIVMWITATTDYVFLIQ